MIGIMRSAQRDKDNLLVIVTSLDRVDGIDKFTAQGRWAAIGPSTPNR